MNTDIAKNKITKQKHNEGLLYFLLGYDGTILYTGSSKDLSNNRLLQSDRMRGPYDSNHITANTIGYEYGKNIYYAVKFKINDYHNIELDLINRFKPKYNTIGKKNYLCKWNNPNYSFMYPPYFILKFVNDIYIDGKFNINCLYEYEFLPIINVMTRDKRNSNYISEEVA
ncbi:hypothetical protein [Clostridium butyricum]|uniref:hypothetical protein n=1 Tax=Clostridium butyricum TaxID=1492 RepID=UPI002103B1E0|nr:hypothetical protein [Clostridium butyricum]MCQ2011971.1 hypothetical protein [Clostridium butyricum]MCQ2027803.1 hypothetical protein [Clostridium butyricum]